MSAPTTVQLSLDTDQLDLLADVKQLLNRYLDQSNRAVWLEEPEAAARLKVSKSTIRKWREQGWLRYCAEGTSVIRYRADYLDADFEARTLVKASLTHYLH